MGLFIVDSAVLELAQELLHIALWSLVLFGMATVFSGAMRAGGTVWMPHVDLDLGDRRGRGPAAAIGSAGPSASKGVWIAYPVTFGTMFVLQMAYYGLVWRKRRSSGLI